VGFREAEGALCAGRFYRVSRIPDKDHRREQSRCVFGPEVSKATSIIGV
jgi:hypothetical protein